MKTLLILTLASFSIFQANAQSWNKLIKVVAPDRAAYDYFGDAVSMSGDYAIVGALNESEDASGINTIDGAGSAFIFEKDASNWSQVQKIVASDRDELDYFGSSVSINGDYAIVGAFHAGIEDTGSAYIFERDGTGRWNEAQILVPSDKQAYASFGYSVSISGNFALVGTPGESIDSLAGTGSAYIFERDGSGNWNLLQKIQASDKGSWDFFGRSVSISGDYAIVGAYAEDEDVAGGNTQDDAGSAYIFERDGGGNWRQVQKIVALYREDGDKFGGSVSISGNYALVGAKFASDAAGGISKYAAGTAYVFERDGSGNWNQGQQILPNDWSSQDNFGCSVSISFGSAIVGACNDSGVVYIFERDSDGNWDQSRKILAPDRSPYDGFGSAVSISGNNAIIAAPREEEDEIGGDTMSAAGSVYLVGKFGVGIIKNDLGLQFSVYPNPNTGKFTIDLGQTYQDVNVSVTNILGQIISNQDFKSKQRLSIDLAGPTGFYLIDVQTEKGSRAMLKVVKE